jgi:pimeloyl-ACP methyl ester carboxylesterase
MRAPELRRVTLPSGVTLEVAERGRGPAVLFLHGITDSWRSFELLLPLLREDLHLVAPSQRGHGESDKPLGGYATEQLATDAAALLEALGVERATVVGHSMGSQVAQALAAAEPQRVERLVLIGSATSFDTPDLREFTRALDELRDPVPTEVARDFQVSTIHKPISDELLATFVRESLKVPAHVWQQAMRGVLQFRSGSFLSRLGMPTLIVWGDHDAIVSRSEQESLRRGIGRSTLRVFDDTGHAVHWERPERFVEELLTFLREKGPAGPGGTPSPR